MLLGSDGEKRLSLRVTGSAPITYGNHGNDGCTFELLC